MYVFVYGTLKRSYPNHYVLQNEENGKAEFVCEAETVELFPLIVATKYEIPFLLDRKGIGKNVVGEVYEIDDTMLKTLDKFEGYPMLYGRQLTDVKSTNSQQTISAWTFTFHSFNENLLSGPLHTNYICNNYDLLRSLSGKVAPEERAALFTELR